MKRALTATLLFAAGTALAASPLETPRHTIEARLQPATGELHVMDEVHVRGRAHYRFQLADWLTVEQLRVNGQRAEPVRVNRHYRVSLPNDQSHTLTFELRGTVPGRDGSPASISGGRSSSGADGAYLPGFADWVPVDESERMHYELTVSVPAGQRVVATGTLMSERSEQGENRATFSVEHAAPPPSVFVGPYVVQEQRHGELRLRTYFHAPLSDLADVYLASARAYIDRYAAIIGDYPYRDFHIVSAPLPVGLGFPNLTYVGQRVLPLPFMRTRSLAHEVLHNWWGNGVAVDYATGNWSEGLTTYMADYALAVEQGDDAARAMRVKWLRDYAALPAARDHPVRAFRAKQHQAAQVIGYNKVAFIFHMLAMELGERSFNEGLALFYRRHAWQTADWSDLQAAFEHSAGRDLGWFFAQWLDRTGAPQLALAKPRVRQTDGVFRAQLELQQTSPHYRLRVPVMLTTTKGVENHTVTLADATTTVAFDTDARPLHVHVDPDGDVFRRLRSEETPPIMRDVTLNADGITLVAAQDPEYRAHARELATRLMDTAPQFGSLAAALASDAPILLITDTQTATEVLAQLAVEKPIGLPTAPHTAAAWTARRGNGAPVLAVSAQDAPSLQALLRPLPHYGGQSYVLFEGRRAAHKGVWPLPRGPLFHAFDDTQ